MNIYNENNLIWIDLEMTGLNPSEHRIIEIAILITDNYLNILMEGPNIVIFQKNKYLFKMNEWNYNIHKNNGLIKEVIKSNISEFKAEKIIINFLKNIVPKKSSPICGNTVAQDRRFLFKYMPKLESYFNYKYIDVTSFREVFNRWLPNIFLKKKKYKNMHRALFDIRNSIKELNYYKKFFFNSY